VRAVTQSGARLAEHAQPLTLSEPAEQHQYGEGLNPTHQACGYGNNAVLHPDTLPYVDGTPAWGATAVPARPRVPMPRNACNLMAYLMSQARRIWNEAWADHGLVTEITFWSGVATESRSACGSSRCAC
jgi:hypothetical protein